MKVKTGHKRYWEILEVMELEGAWGETRPDSRQVVLKKDDPERLFTLFHELLHVASFDEKICLTEKQVLGLEKWIKKLVKHGGFKKLKDYAESI
jgi:hypothetical protein